MSAARPHDADRCIACMALRGGAAVCPHCGHDESLDPPPGRHLPPRTVLAGRYLVGRVLGEGGFGITYLAWDRTLDNRRAIKEYFPEDAAQRAEGSTVEARSRTTRALYDDGLERFLTEARTLEKFQDEPGIVQVRDFFPANGTGYLVMGYLEGRTVKALLEEHGGRFDYDVALPLLLPVMDALQKVHDTGLLHRDISPDNLMIGLNRQVRLLDFGAAKSLVSDRSRSIASVFKKGYTPYEQYLDDARLGPPTDVYALAATLYRMLTGRVPQGALERHQDDRLPPPEVHGVLLPPAASQALMRALAVSPSQRFPTVQAFRDALLAAGANQPAATVPGGLPAPRPPAPPPPPRRTLGDASWPVPPDIAPPSAPAPAQARWLMWSLPVGIAAVLGAIAWLGGDRAPTLTAIEVPEAFVVGRPATLRLRFEDRDADLDRIEFVSREGSWRIDTQDLKARHAKQTSGSVELQLTARTPERASVEAVIYDRAGHSSRRAFQLVSVAPPASPPVLQRVDAPRNAVVGQPFLTRVAFSDPDGDVRRLTVVPLDSGGNFPPVDLSGPQRQGQLSYQIRVGAPGRYRYQLQDAAGLQSRAVDIEVEVTAPRGAPAPSTQARPAPREPAWTPSPDAGVGQLPPPPPPPEPTPLQDASRVIDQILRHGGLRR